MKEVSILKAKALKSGDTVGLISPASSISEKQYEESLNHLQRLGLTVITGTHTLKEHGHLGGLDHQRLEDLHAMFANPEIDGIWCARGGYGCTRLLPDIDFDLIRRNPKPIIGFSDITALLNAIYIKTGLIGFHGPLGISKVTDFSKKGLEATIFGGVSPYKISLLVQDESVYTIREGSRKGQFVGGNLSLLAAMTGTPHQPDYREKLVFIEEIAEKPYQIDRMLTQLLNGTNLQEAHGIILGTFVRCGIPQKGSSLTLEATLRDRLDKLDIPIIYGAPIGHIDNQLTIPVGGMGELTANSEEISIQLLESGTQQPT